MAIPDYQPLKLPVLKLASDGNEQILSSAIEELKDEFWIDADPSNLTLLIKSI